MLLSCKGEDHSEIKIELQKELDALSKEGKMFNHGGLKRIIKVKTGKLLLCVDRPERTSILQVGDHNGTFSTFWGHSCKVDGYCQENHLPFCKDCRKHHLHGIFAEKNHESNETDMFPVGDGENNIHVECNTRNNMVQACNEENVHHGISFILHLNFVYQQTIQPTMTNGLMPHCLLMKGTLIYQFKEQNECCVPFV